MQLSPVNPAVPGLGDGGIGTMLQSLGLEERHAPERWTLEHPERVREVHERYVAAGAGWITTNTFGANRARLALSNLEERHDRLNREAVALARVSREVPVLASLGPTGAPAAEWARNYEEQVAALGKAGPDGFLVETIVSLEEGCAAVRAAAAAGQVWATFTPAPGGGLLDGTPPERAAEALARSGASVVGVNCGAGVESLLTAASRLVRAGIRPVLAAPNAGLPVRRHDRLLYDLSPDGFANGAIQFQELGVTWIAGCCGTTPAHIAAAHRALRKHLPAEIT